MVSMPRVLICDKLEPSGLDLLKQAGLEVDNRPGLKGDDLKAALHAADGCIVRSSTRLTAELLDEPGRLRAIARAGVGVDNIDVAAATRRGIVVMNTPGGNTFSTAELTLSVMMSLARNIPAADASVKAGKWEKTKFTGSQRNGKTLGIVVVGNICRVVARVAVALGMTVLGYEPFLSPEKAGELGIERATDLDAILPRCDFLTVHVTLNEQTRNLLDAARLAKLKKGARVINCARGGIINELALAEALKGGHLAGAALDVFEQEPLPADHPLLKAPNVVLTPHLGASTREAQLSVALEAAHLLIDFLQKGEVRHAVNMTPVDRAEMQELRQYLDMARRLGMLHAQMDHGTIHKVELTYRGEVARRSTRLLTAAFAAGMLEGRLAQHVNIVN